MTGTQYCIAIALFGALAFLCGYVIGHDYGRTEATDELRPVMTETRERLELVNGLLGPLECRVGETKLLAADARKRLTVLPGGQE